jgi:dihydroorotate dehydrogenase (fumarate)
MEMAANFLGLRLKKPLIAGASTPSYELDSVRHVEEPGTAAVVVYSLFQKDIEKEADAFDLSQSK